MLLNRGELDGRRLLSAESVKQMTTNQIGPLSPFIANHGDKFGYGFGVVTEATSATTARQPEEVASLGAYSWGGIFHTYFLVDPEQDLIAIFATQIFPFDHLTLHADFKRAVYAAMLP
jgi:CubicO group peptidase (beta-lactamase class C family)